MARDTIDRFDFGITDYIYSGNKYQSELLDNFVITKERGIRTKPGSEFFDLDFPQLPTGNQRVNDFFVFRDTLFARSASKLYQYISGTGWSEIQGPSGGDAIPNGTVDTEMSTAELANILIMTDYGNAPQKLYKDSTDVFQLRTAGLPDLSSDPAIAPDANDAKNYVYRFVYKYTYDVEGVTFVDVSPYSQVSVANGSDFSGVGHYHQITAIPNDVSGDNYDSANVVVDIYRTIHNGGVNGIFYLTGSSTPGGTFQDTTDDTSLVNNQKIYTANGAKQNDPPPNANFVASANNCIWYVDADEPNKIIQGIQDDPDSVPASFYRYLDSDITGIGAIGKYPIVMCESGTVYRIEGVITFRGRGSLRAVPIHDIAGCNSQNSITRTDRGLVWAGVDGFYYTNGFKVYKVSSNIDKTYKDTSTSLTDRNTYVAYDKKQRRVFFACDVDSNNDNTKLYVSDEDFIWQSEDGNINAPFTTWSGQQYDCDYNEITDTSFRPTAICFFNDYLIRGDSRGYIFEHRDTYYTDPKVDTSLATSDWKVETIMHNWKHIAHDFGVADVQKWVSKVSSICQNESNLMVKFNSFDDGTIIPKRLKTVVFTNDMTWRSPFWIWEDDEAVWRENLEIKKTRWMVKGKLMTRYKQLQIINAYDVISVSSESSEATVATGATNYVTMESLEYSFDSRSYDYYIRFEDDDYVNEYQITEVDTDGSGYSRLTILDPSGTLVAGSSKAWKIYGFEKGQVLHLNQLVFDYELFSDRDAGYYRSAETKSNS